MDKKLFLKTVAEVLRYDDKYCKAEYRDALIKLKSRSKVNFVSQYYVENNHEAIIPRQLFIQVQEELQRRAHLRTEDRKTKRVYSSKYALSSII